MNKRRNHSKRRIQSSRFLVWNYWPYWALALCVIAGSFAALGIFVRHEAKREASAHAIRAVVSESVLRESVDTPERRIYPYSVIPGGVRSAEELRNAIAYDPLVARHYANFDVSRARVIRLKHDVYMYASYRLADHIYWTKRRLLLRKGETVITDGEHEARTRCGNRLSKTPVEPVSPNEPPKAAMNTPASPTLLAEDPGFPPTVNIGPLPVVQTPVTGPPAANPPGGPIPPPSFPIVGCCGGQPGTSSTPTPPPPPTPVATPEPSALLLLIIGFVALGVVSGLAKLRNQRCTRP